MIEKFLIAKFDLTHTGYNIAEGGKGGKHGHMLTGVNHPNSKTVYRYSLSGQYIDNWVNAIEAGKQLHIHSGDIRNAVYSEGKRAAGGYLWSYVESDKMPSHDEYIGGTIKEFPKIYRVDFYG